MICLLLLFVIAGDLTVMGANEVSVHNARTMCESGGGDVAITVTDKTVIHFPAQYIADCVINVKSDDDRLMTMTSPAITQDTCTMLSLTHSQTTENLCNLRETTTKKGEILKLHVHDVSVGQAFNLTFGPFHLIDCGNDCQDTGRTCGMVAFSGILCDSIAEHCPKACDRCNENCCYVGKFTKKTNQFKLCDSNKCIDASMMCDGISNCRDGSDENQCHKTTETTTEKIPTTELITMESTTSDIDAMFAASRKRAKAKAKELGLSWKVPKPRDETTTQNAGHSTAPKGDLVVSSVGDPQVPWGGGSGGFVWGLAAARGMPTSTEGFTRKDGVEMTTSGGEIGRVWGVLLIGVGVLGVVVN